MTSAPNDATRDAERDYAHNAEPSRPLSVGARAPEFMLRTTPDQEVCLSDFRGQPVILAFYPADWSPVCGDQMALYNEILPEFQRYGAELVGISVDGVWCHLAFAKDRKLRFPLLSDFEPKGATARQYGVYRHRDGVTERALFVIDGEGVIQWSYVSPIGVNPGADGILRALDSMQAGQATDGQASGQAQPSNDAQSPAPDQEPASSRQPAATAQGRSS
jgi:peroxiredoxin